MHYDRMVKMLELKVAQHESNYPIDPKDTFTIEVAKLKGIQELVTAIRSLTKTIAEQGKQIEDAITREGEVIACAARGEKIA